MDKQKIFKFLEYMGFRHNKTKIQSNKWMMHVCVLSPWTHQKGLQSTGMKAGITISKGGISTYHCFVCKSRGSLLDIALSAQEYNKTNKIPNYSIKKAIDLVLYEEDDAEFEILDFEDTRRHVTANPVIKWKDKFLNEHKYVYNYPQAITYLNTRQISKKVIKFLDLRYDVKRKRVIFPIRDWYGNLIGMNGRDITGRCKTNPEHPTYFMYKYKDTFNALPWYGEHWVNMDMPVLIVESVFDLASVLRVYPNCICSLTCGMSRDKVLRIGHALEIVTLYDYGTGGDTARESISQYLKNPIIHHLKPTEYQGDPGNMGKEELKQILKGYIL